MTPTAARAVTPILVGREREMEALAQALRDAGRGAGRGVLLAGEAGIGKSRLVDEFCRGAAAERPLTLLRGHCSEQDVEYPYAPWADALRAFLAPHSGPEMNDLLGTLAPALVRLLPELPLLVPGLSPATPLDPESEKHRLFETLVRFTTQLTAGGPLIVVLEDLHWSDEPSLELMRHVARRTINLPILLVGTYRADEPSPRLAHHLGEMSRERLAEEIILRPLDRVGVGEMARALLSTAHPEGSPRPSDAAPRDGTPHPLAAALLDQLTRLTEGNPYFVEEVLKALVDAREVALVDGVWRYAQRGAQQHTPEDVPRLPRTVQDVVRQRVERLPAEPRRVLALAAVMGQRFDFGLLQEVTALDEHALLRTLRELIAAQLIVEESADRFAFRHALTREAVYATLMLRERRALHRAIGEALERRYPGDAHAAELAYHFYQAEAWGKALDTSQRAGAQALAQYAPDEARAHFSRALQAAQQLGSPVPLAALRGRAQAEELLSEFDAAQADYEAALESASRGPSRADESRTGEWQALVDLGFLWLSRDLARAGEYLNRALELARALGDDAGVAGSLNRVGNWYISQGRVREALQAHGEALELFSRLGDRRGTAQTLELLGVVCYHTGEVVQGAEYCERAVPLLRELDDRQGLVNTLTNLSLRARLDTEVLGDTDVGRLATLSEEALEVARSFDWRQGEHMAYQEQALCLIQAGDFTPGLELLRRAEALAGETQHRFLLVGLRLTYGEAWLGLLDFTRARQSLEAALTVAQQIGSVLFTHYASAKLASACVRHEDAARLDAARQDAAPPDAARAEALLSPLLHTEYPEDAFIPIAQRAAWAGRAELELALGRPDRALGIVDALLARTANLDRYGPHAVPLLSLLRGRALAALGRPEEAAAEYMGAQPVARAQGRRPLLWQLHADLGEVYRAAGRHTEADNEFSSARAIVEAIASALPDLALREGFTRRALGRIIAAPEPAPASSGTTKQGFGGLSERERQVAALVARGMTNREIAGELVVALRTVEAHITRINDKLDLHSRTEIALWAAANGLGLDLKGLRNL